MTEPSDTRLIQILAAFDDARTLIADLFEEDVPEGWTARLASARQLANMAIREVRPLTDQPQCDSYMTTGGRCDLRLGHAGRHQKAYGNTIRQWSDEDHAGFADRYSSRFD